VGHVDAYVQILGYAVWPLTVLAIAGAFRTELAALIRRMKRIEGKGFAAEFEADLTMAEVERAAIAKDQPERAAKEATEEPRRPIPLPPSAVEAVLVAVARQSPQAAIEQAWTEIQMAINVICRQSLPNLAPDQIIWHLQREGVVSVQTGAVFVRLHKLRNDARHADQDGVKSDAAERYVKLALQLAKDIRDAGDAMARAA